MRNPRNNIINMVDGVGLDAQEVKTAQITSQNSGMIGYNLKTSEQTISLPNSGGSGIPISLTLVYTPKNGRPAVVYPYINYSVDGVNDSYIVDGTAYMQKVTLSDGSQIYINDVLGDGLKRVRTGNNSMRWVATMYYFTNGTHKLTLYATCRATDGGQLSLTYKL